MARGSAKLGRSVLDLDVEDGAFVQGLDKNRARAQKFTDDTGRMVRDAGRAIGSVGEGMTRNITLPIVAAGAAATKFGLDFDTTLRQVVGLTDVTEGEIAGIREELIKLGPEVGKSPQELAEAFYFVSSAGFTANEAMDVLRTSAKAAASGLGETQSVAQVLGSVINAYGKENITAARAADILVEAISQGTAEAPEFASVIGRVAPTAAALGVSFDQVAASLAGMTLTGLSAEESATSLNQVFVSLLKPTSQAEDAMRDLGLTSEGLRRQLREEGLLATLRTLEERFAGNEEAAAAVFGNIRALRGVTSLLTLDSEQLNSVFGKVTDSAGRLGEAYAETEGPQREIDRAMADLQATAIELGEDVIPMVVSALKSIAGVARGVAGWWRSLDDTTQETVVRFLAFVAAAGPVLIVVGKLVKGLGSLITVVKWLSGAQGLAALATKIPMVGTAVAGLLGPLGLAAAGLAALGVVGGEVHRQLRPVEHDFNELASQVGKSRQEIEGEVHRLAQSLGRDADDIRERLSRLLLRGIDWDTAVQMVEDGLGGISEALLKSGQDWEDYQNQINGSTAAAAADAAALPPEVEAALNAGDISGEAAELMDPVAEAAQKAKEAAIQSMTDMITNIESLLAEGPDTIQDEINALHDALIDPYTDVERRADLETGLAMDAVVANLESGDKLTEEKAFAQVNNWLQQYDLLAPGALARGELVNPALQDGIDSNLDAALQWLQDNVTGPVEDKFDLAETLNLMGYTAMGEYVLGIARREAGEELALTAIAVRAVNSLDATEAARQGGWSIGGAWVYAMEGAIYDNAWRIINALGYFRSILGNSLPTAGPLRGDLVAHGGADIGGTWIGNLAGSIMDGRRALGTQLTGVTKQLDLSTRVPTPALPGASALAMGAGASLGVAGTQIGGEVHYHWELHVEGQKKVVGTKQEAIAELERVGSTWG